MHAVGLDFGTTNSALASILENGSPEVLKINNTDSPEPTLRSVILVSENRGEILVGQQAIDRYVLRDGLDGRFLQSLKAFLPSPSFTGTQIFGQVYELEDLLAMILREAKRNAEARLSRGISDVTLGRPVVFSEDTQQDRLAAERLFRAARRAGFAKVKMEYEPVAATLAYLSQLPEGKEEVVLMGDFGGGTSDFTVMKLQAGAKLSQEQKRERVLSVGGIYIGGDTFDGRIMWEKVARYFGRDLTWKSRGEDMSVPAYIVRGLCQWHQIPFLRDPRTMDTIDEIRRRTKDQKVIQALEELILGGKGFMIFQAIERAKKQLSHEEEAIILYKDGNIQIEEKITRKEFEAMIAKDIEKIMICVLQTMSKAHLEPKDISRVLLTGGSSFIPAIRNMFANTFGESKLLQLDAFTSVAQGLALAAKAD